jgi:AraC-like DNA-binding protein
MMKNNDIYRNSVNVARSRSSGDILLTSQIETFQATLSGAQAITVAALSEKLAHSHHALIQQNLDDISTSIGVGRYDIEEYQPHIFVGMLIKGRHDSIIDGQEYAFEHLNMPTLFSVGHHAEACSLQKEGELCEIIGINIEPEFLMQYADHDRAFGTLAGLLDHPVIHREFVGGELLRCLLAGMVQSPYTGVMGQLYRESQALAVIVELGRQVESEFEGRPSFVLRSRQERAEQTRLLIEENLGAPYSIGELSRRVGSNETTLRLDFKALFGKTIFEYLRDRRLDIARLLVHEKALSIAEIAYRCGYSSPANFTTAYRRRFGMPPSQG